MVVRVGMGNPGDCPQRPQSDRRHPRPDPTGPAAGVAGRNVWPGPHGTRGHVDRTGSRCPGFPGVTGDPAAGRLRDYVCTGLDLADEMKRAGETLARLTGPNRSLQPVPTGVIP
jgi:hypothetical protein